MILLLATACAGGPAAERAAPPTSWPEQSVPGVPAGWGTVASRGERLAIGDDQGRVWVDGEVHETGLEGIREVEVSACCVVASDGEALWWRGADGATRTVPTPECLGCTSLAVSDEGHVVYGPVLLRPDGTKRELYGPADPTMVAWGEGGVLYGATHDLALTWRDVEAMPEVRPLQPAAIPVHLNGPYLLRDTPVSAVIDLRTGEEMLRPTPPFVATAVRADGLAVLGPVGDVPDGWGTYDRDGPHLVGVGMVREGAFVGDQVVLVGNHGAVTRHRGELPMAPPFPRDAPLVVDEHGAVAVGDQRIAPELRVQGHAVRVGDQVVFAAWQGEQEAVVAVDVASGREVWRQVLDEGDGVDVLHRIGDDVVFGDWGGWAAVVAPDGTVQARFRAGFAEPVAARSAGVLGTVGEHAITLGSRTVELGYDLTPHAIAPHPDGFVVGYDDGLREVRGFDGERLSSLGLVHQKVTWTPDGILVTAGLDGQVTWLGVDGAVVSRRELLGEPIRHLAMVEDTVVVGGSTTLSVGGKDRSAGELQAVGGGAELIWADSEAVHHPDHAYDAWMVDQLATSDGGTLAVRSTMTVEIDRGGELAELDVQGEAIAWAGDRLLVATGEGLVDAERPGQVVVPATDVQVLSVAGDVVAAGSWSGRVSLWTLQGERLFRRRFLGLVDGVAVAPDGQHVAVALEDGTVRLLDRAGRERWVARFTGGPPTVYPAELP